MTETRSGGGRSDVLVVGAGPASRFAACELARQGVVPRVVERQPVPHRQARATAIQPAGLELLARAGVLAPFLDQAIHVRRTRLLGPGFKEIGTSSFDGVGCEHEYQCSLPQWRTEDILLGHYRRLGGEIERGITVLSVDDDGDGLRVALRRPDGETEVIRVRYVLGAGGAHSITRHSMHEALDGQTYASRYVVADIRADVPHEPEMSMVFVSAGAFALLSPLPEDRWINFINLDEGEEPPAEPGDPPGPGWVSAVLSRRVGTDVRARDVRWTAQFTMHSRSTPRLAEGGRFLIGDAAHLSSPIAGQGLNAALMDAADIAWKLALVMRGAGLPSLLDSYAVERGLAHGRVLAVSEMLHGRVADLVAACAGPGLAAQPEPADAARALAQARARAMLDVSYANSPLVGERLGPGVSPATGSPTPASTSTSTTGCRPTTRSGGTRWCAGPSRRRWTGRR